MRTWACRWPPTRPRACSTPASWCSSCRSTTPGRTSSTSSPTSCWPRSGRTGSPGTSGQASPPLACVPSCYAFSGTVLLGYANVIYLVGAAWLPAAVLAADRMLRERRRRWAVAFGAVLALMTLGGDPQMAYNAGLLAMFEAGFLWWTARRSSGKSNSALSSGVAARSTFSLFALAVLVAFALAAVQVIPSIRFTRTTGRAATETARSVYEIPAMLGRDDAGRRIADGLLCRSLAADSHHRQRLRVQRRAVAAGRIPLAQLLGPAIPRPPALVRRDSRRRTPLDAVAVHGRVAARVRPGGNAFSTWPGDHAVALVGGCARGGRQFRMVRPGVAGAGDSHRVRSGPGALARRGSGRRLVLADDGAAARLRLLPLSGEADGRGGIGAGRAGRAGLGRGVVRPEGALPADTVGSRGAERVGGDRESGDSPVVARLAGRRRAGHAFRAAGHRRRGQRPLGRIHPDRGGVRGRLVAAWAGGSKCRLSLRESGGERTLLSRSERRQWGETPLGAGGDARPGGRGPGRSQRLDGRDRAGRRVAQAVALRRGDSARPCPARRDRGVSRLASADLDARRRGKRTARRTGWPRRCVGSGTRFLRSTTSASGSPSPRSTAR